MLVNHVHHELFWAARLIDHGSGGPLKEIRKMVGSRHKSRTCVCYSGLDVNWTNYAVDHPRAVSLTQVEHD